MGEWVGGWVGGINRIQIVFGQLKLVCIFKASLSSLTIFENYATRKSSILTRRSKATKSISATHV